MTLPLGDFDYEYPESLIASAASEPRDSARLMVLNRAEERLEHGIFRDLPRHLKPGDCLVLNRTKVMPCRLFGKKTTGGKADLLLVRELSPTVWTALASGFKAGQRLEFPGGMTAVVEGLTDEGEYRLRFAASDLRPYLAEHGLPPLPPYIAKKRVPSRADAARYQTVYARDDGSIAAPTAGMHFTPELLEALEVSGVIVSYLTLHVGRGTFRPITSEDASAHKMLAERYELEPAEASLIAGARARGGRVVSVGTTTTRTLETLAARPEGFGPGSGESSLYITPGYRFLGIDALITNFHLPRSTPLLLASAFAGRERLLSAYREAVSLGYRLYSFGDATLVL
ncbi:MAG: tRNA preQ1(34) S-adenosylmethionine ribosyltransferase-isomerase QueA [Elusimicrobia bacterium CG11_big_fil_rev_8_21_14_0_20_64_6]|nr:MAG: tRNA preQ1(34) S-adenosylmethionine ribosyltransferase-isomerase QueA [Elusimicrobia bacterium CG11_big_fil_rev_8_21_14_0_20_64_6]